MTGPLDGIRVIDLSSFVAGPSCTMQLAQLGADVLRIDHSAGAPDGRRMPRAADGSSLYWAGLNKGKRVAGLDLREGAGREVVHELLRAGGEDGGILVTNAIGQDWLSYSELSTARPDLILVHIEGHPSGEPAVDYTINADAGIAEIQGRSDSTEPVNSVLPAWDLLLGLHAALAIVTAVRRRESTGEGAELRIALADVAAATLGHLGYVGEARSTSARARDDNYLYGTFGRDFVGSDGGRVMVTALTPRHWRQLLEATGSAGTVGALATHLGVDFTEEESRYEHRRLLAELFAPWFAERTAEESVSALRAAQVPVGRYRTPLEMATLPDGLLARSAIFDECDHGTAGRYPVPRSVIRTSAWAIPALADPDASTAQQVLDEWAATAASHAEVH